MPKRAVALLALAVMVLWVTPLQAQDADGGDVSLTGGPSFTDGVRPTGMGMAYTGVATGASALFHNPGGIASKMMYQVEGTYEYNPGGSVLNASIVDSKTNPEVAAGISYSYYFGRGDLSDASGHSVRLGLALPVLPERISIGVGGRYLVVSAQELEIIHTFTLDAGALFRVTDSIQFGVAGQNLIDVCERHEMCGGIAPTMITGGVSFGNENTFLLAIDGGIDLTSDPEGVQPIIEAGAEYFAGGTVPLRVGYQRLEATDQNMITAGLGVRMQSAGLDAGFRMDLGESENFYANGSVSIYF